MCHTCHACLRDDCTCGWARDKTATWLAARNQPISDVESLVPSVPNQIMLVIYFCPLTSHLTPRRYLIGYVAAKLELRIRRGDITWFPPIQVHAEDNLGPLHWHRLTFNHSMEWAKFIHYEMWEELTYPLSQIRVITYHGIRFNPYQLWGPLDSKQDDNA